LAFGLVSSLVLSSMKSKYNEPMLAQSAKRLTRKSLGSKK